MGRDRPALLENDTEDSTAQSCQIIQQLGLLVSHWYRNLQSPPFLHIHPRERLLFIVRDASSHFVKADRMGTSADGAVIFG